MIEKSKTVDISEKIRSSEDPVVLASLNRVSDDDKNENFWFVTRRGDKAHFHWLSFGPFVNPHDGVEELVASFTPCTNPQSFKAGALGRGITPAAISDHSEFNDMVSKMQNFILDARDSKDKFRYLDEHGMHFLAENKKGNVNGWNSQRVPTDKDLDEMKKALDDILLDKHE